MSSDTELGDLADQVAAALKEYAVAAERERDPDNAGAFLAASERVARLLQEFDNHLLDRTGRAAMYWLNMTAVT